MVEDIPKSSFILNARYIGAPVSMGRPHHGDLWPMSWADDGKLYAAVGDGTGFNQEKDLYTLCMAFEVDPERNCFAGRDLAPGTFRNLGSYGDLPNYKPTGMFAANGKLYLFIQDLSPQWRIGIAKNAKLLVSCDSGDSWEDIGVLFPDKFTTPTFLQAGQGYSDAEDDYAYLYSPKYNWFEEDELFLARVPMSQIDNRDAYEFFCGKQVEKWTGDIADMRPVFHCAPKYVQQCEVVYIKPLKRYIMVQWRLGTKECNPNNDHYSELYLLESPRPWGPWSLFHYDKNWGVNSLDYRYCGRIPTNLISDDGLTFYLQYSGWSPVENEPSRTPYNFTVQKIELELEDLNL